MVGETRVVALDSFKVANVYYIGGRQLRSLQVGKMESTSLDSNLAFNAAWGYR